MLETTCAVVGYPKTIGVEQGSEFIRQDLDLRVCSHAMTLNFSRPREPTDNPYIKAFNGRYRAECLTPPQVPDDYRR